MSKQLSTTSIRSESVVKLANRLNGSVSFIVKILFHAKMSGGTTNIERTYWTHSQYKGDLRNER